MEDRRGPMPDVKIEDLRRFVVPELKPEPHQHLFGDWTDHQFTAALSGGFLLAAYWTGWVGGFYKSVVWSKKLGIATSNGHVFMRGYHWGKVSARRTARKSVILTFFGFALHNLFNRIRPYTPADRSADLKRRYYITPIGVIATAWANARRGPAKCARAVVMTLPIWVSMDYVRRLFNKDPPLNKIHN
eukprot:TRINITY_DN25327_c0_g1_i1.p1 TRINITY_DN25327_c0_g1~~TRINITY_DN25327_c0_g1_i1.p1  ORF type:complete len:188 (-),score=0.59 TRINITY_DN25327_c0_g1_i1:84-647(-)